MPGIFPEQKERSRRREQRRKIYWVKIKDIFVIFNTQSQKSESDEVNQAAEERGDIFSLVCIQL